MLYNYHTHTYRCGHAAPDEREYIENAIQAGIKTLGFSDHSPYFFHDGYYSNFRMRPETAYEYFDTLNNLREEYKDRIDIKIGFETEYYPEFFGKLMNFYKNFNVEYLILGQHFLDNELRARYSGQPTVDECIIEKYVNQVIEGMETGKYTYVAHPDLLNFQGELTIYRKHFSRLCRKSIELDIPLEINFLGLSDGRPYPNKSFWELAGELGAPVVFGADAHYPKALNDPATEQRALEMCLEYSLNLRKEISLNPV